MATVLAAAGVHVYALDVRGHGKSGPKGHIPLMLDKAALKSVVEQVIH